MIVGLQVSGILVEEEVDDKILTGSCFQFLFLEPNASDPLNKEAAEDLRMNREGFKRNVRAAMAGGAVKSERYDKVNK